jgi:hypothetical protein
MYYNVKFDTLFITNMYISKRIFISLGNMTYPVSLTARHVLKSRVFVKNLVKTVRGYHLVNGAPIKEAVWEGILASSLSVSGIEYDWNNGGHQSGRDISVVDGVRRVGVSCKSCKDKPSGKQLTLSSYRMTKCRDAEEFVKCIDFERANFDFYGILSRCETEDLVRYAVHFVPSELVKASKLEWIEKTDKEGKSIVGWESQEVDGVKMSVVRSMSNQLWIKLRKEAFKEYCVLDGLEVRKDVSMNYAMLYDVIGSQTQ